jgi:hypothetical protein
LFQQIAIAFDAYADFTQNNLQQSVTQATFFSTVQCLKLTGKKLVINLQKLV